MWMYFLTGKSLTCLQGTMQAGIDLKDFLELKECKAQVKHRVANTGM